MYKHFFNSLAILTALSLATGCAATGPVIERVEVLEKEVADLHRANRELAKRLDEIQIQLSLLLKKIVVKSEPESQVDGNSKSYKSRRTQDITAEPTDVVSRQQDPSVVDERLPVDLTAADIPILGGLTIEPDSGDDTPVFEDGLDEESITNEWNRVMSHLEGTDLGLAADHLSEFAESYPEHPLSAEALYMLGNIRFSRGEFDDAQVDFFAVSRQHPDSRFAAGAMLMSARCREEMGRRKDARSIYLQLVQAYPLSEEAAEANRRLRSIQ